MANDTENVIHESDVTPKTEMENAQADFPAEESPDNNLENADALHEDLPNYDGPGVLKYNCRIDGKLKQLYTPLGNHVGVIAATRMGKSTSVVIPYIRSFAKMKRKKSFMVSDPKGEIYRRTANALRAEGYEVLLLNLRDALHSEYWNPLTPIRRKYLAAFDIYNEVEVVKNGIKSKYKLREQIFKNKKTLDDKGI